VRWGTMLCAGVVHDGCELKNPLLCEHPFEPPKPLFDPKPDFLHMAKPENVTQSFLLDIVAMTEPGATINLSGFSSLYTNHVEQLCDEWMKCGRVPRKLILHKTLVDGGLILSSTFLRFLTHPQVFVVDVRQTSFLECANAPLLQRLILDGTLDRMLYCDIEKNETGLSVPNSAAQERVQRLRAFMLDVSKI